MINWIRKTFGKKESRTVSVRAVPGGAKTVWPERNYDNFARETYLKNATAFAAIFEVSKAGASVPWKVFEKIGDKEEPVDDPLDIVLKRANPEESFAFVMVKTLAYLVMCGNAYKEKLQLETGPNKGQVREIYSHRPDRMKLDTKNGRLIKYVYEVDGRKTEWEVDEITRRSDILQLKTFHPLSDWFGAAATESGAREIDTSNASVEWNKNLLDNQGRPGGVFTLVGSLGAQAFDEMERYLESRSGPSHAGKDLIITGERGTGYAPYGWSPTDMDFGEGDVRLMRKIAMVYGVPPELLGIESSTFNNRKEARLYFWENTVLWWLNYVKGELNNWLFPLDSKRFVNYVLDNVPAFSEKRDKLWKRAQDSDFLMVNEKREMVGLASYGPAGDVIFVEASKIPLTADTGEEGQQGQETEDQARQRLLDEGYDEDEIDEMLGLKEFKTICFEPGDIDLEIPLEDLVEIYSAKMMPTEEKPYPNEHACRLREPAQFDQFARVGCFRKSGGKCIDYIFGIKGGKSVVQALRYKKRIWSASAARSHCQGRGGKFEAAGKGE